MARSQAEISFDETKTIALRICSENFILKWLKTLIFLGFWAFLCYNGSMKTLDMKGLAPEITAYISGLEKQLQEQAKTIESQKVSIDRLTDMLVKFQKTMYGQSSEKRKYVLGEDTNQLSLFNEAEVEADRNAPEPKTITVSGHVRKNKCTKEELAANVPVVEILCELDKEQRVCGTCGGKIRILGKETVREELEFWSDLTKLDTQNGAFLLFS